MPTLTCWFVRTLYCFIEKSNTFCGVQNFRALWPFFGLKFVAALHKKLVLSIVRILTFSLSFPFSHMVLHGAIFNVTTWIMI